MSQPLFSSQAEELRRYIRSLSVEEIAKCMKVSHGKAAEVHKLYAAHHTKSPAAECFRGDIYSGLRALNFTKEERSFAQSHLLILSGLYGILRPYDAIEPYRLEAAYRLPNVRFANLYSYWKDILQTCIDPEALIINVTSKEYEKLITQHLPKRQVIPRFLTRKSPAAEPEFVTVHAKIARGAFARWIIAEQTETPNFEKFKDLGYQYSVTLSTTNQPTYITEDFGGIGLSQRTK